MTSNTVIKVYPLHRTDIVRNSHIESGVYFFTKIVIHLHVYVHVYGGSKVE
jgi:hypothetical protein